MFTAALRLMIQYFQQMQRTGQVLAQAFRLSKGLPIGMQQAATIRFLTSQQYQYYQQQL
jgi:hypothetical protein